MSAPPEPGAVDPELLEGAILRRAGEARVHRDIHALVGFVRERGLTLKQRDNGFRKADARKLAALMSVADSGGPGGEDSGGAWAWTVLDIARRLGLVSIGADGEKAGVRGRPGGSPDSQVEIDEMAWEFFVSLGPAEAERAILNTLIEAFPSEFYHRATLIPDDTFDRWGAAVGAAARMDLPAIRRALLGHLATLRVGVWYDMRGLVDWLQARAPHLILDPDTRQPDRDSAARLRQWEQALKYRFGGKEHLAPPRPTVELADIYLNFKEKSALEPWANGTGLTSETPDVFHKVEGRYLAWFLAEIPFLTGLVELALRSPEDRHGLDVRPEFERVVAVRLTRRVASVVLGEAPAPARIVVQPNFEVIIESAFYPGGALTALLAFAELTQEAPPIYRLVLDRKKAIAHLAECPDADSPIDVLEGLTGAPIPQNIAADLKNWAGRAERLTVYDGCGVVELRGDKALRDAALLALGDQVVDDRMTGFVLVRDPEEATALLRAAQLVPEPVQHPRAAFAPVDGVLGGVIVAEAASPEAAPPARKPASVSFEDLVGLRSDQPDLLRSLHTALDGRAATCVLVGDGQLIVSASALPQVRKALRALSGQYAIERKES